MSVDGQVEILNKIVSIMHASAVPGYNSLRCEFEYEAGDGGWSAGAKFSYFMNEISVSECLDSVGVVYELLHDLNEVMKAHSGGSWRVLVVEFAEGGKVKTKFYY